MLRENQTRQNRGPGVLQTEPVSATVNISQYKSYHLFVPIPSQLLCLLFSPTMFRRENKLFFSSVLDEERYKRIPKKGKHKGPSFFVL